MIEPELYADVLLVPPCEMGNIPERFVKVVGIDMVAQVRFPVPSFFKYEVFAP